MILVIGYGNPLRGDDAVGQQVAQMLEMRLLRDDLYVLTTYQLTPELAQNISHAQLVIFIDARDGSTPGTVVQISIQSADARGAFTHHVSPSSLLAAARDLYNTCPQAILFSVTGESFGYGQSLSLAVQAAVPRLLAAIEKTIEQFAAPCHS
jgi:hydrogenase maturation protease